MAPAKKPSAPTVGSPLPRGKEDDDDDDDHGHEEGGQKTKAQMELEVQVVRKMTLSDPSIFVRPPSNL